ncbi:MAG: glycosyltransferase family 1 protein [Clostridiaceae bacterium]|nr:glycosyltransferase family 1 protein [Clostridiaceae bacterium]
MKILYITFIDFNKDVSGSSARPHRIYEAFIDLGCDVKIVEGQQNKRRERREKVKDVLRWLDCNCPDICYVEPPTGPFFNSIDLKLLKKIHAMRIPIGLFYRDAHWKFRELFPMNRIKSLVLEFMHKRDLRVFEDVCDYIYFPSDSFSQLFSNYTFKNTGVLPPGGSSNQFTKNIFSAKHFIYIGGTSELYGGLKLIEVFKDINKEKKVASLTFISQRTEEFHAEDYDYPWLNAMHTFDRELIEAEYSKSTYAIIPFKRNKYFDLALPIKLFEYVGYGIPVISTDCLEIKTFIKYYNCGIICHDNKDSIKDAVLLALDDENAFLSYKRSAVEAGKRNSWVSRAQSIIDDLSGVVK